ncbi:MAG: zinc-dependent peptidase [Crocinitomicaceae bacterium]
MENLPLYIGIGVAAGIAIGYTRLTTKSKSRQKKEPTRPFPKEWRSILEQKIEFYNRLSSTDKREFEKRVHVFLLNVNIKEENTNVTHDDRILIASGAIIPIFRFKSWHYANLKEVILHPNKFSIPNSSKMANGLIGWGAMEGKMWLSRKALQHGFYDQSDNKNVAIHEFIHILDKQDGKMDGIMKQVMNEVDLMPWLSVIHQKMKEISIDDSTIRDYGATNEAEFLAVVSEFFFENPEKMKIEHPALYNALDSFFNKKRSF